MLEFMVSEPEVDVAVASCFIELANARSRMEEDPLLLFLPLFTDPGDPGDEALIEATEGGKKDCCCCCCWWRWRAWGETRGSLLVLLGLWASGDEKLRALLLSPRLLLCNELFGDMLEGPVPVEGDIT